jgi:superfamily II DNA or RNA helicase
VRSVVLRRWQKHALDAWEAAAQDGRRDFLTVATPGAGKTTFAAVATVRWLGSAGRGRVVVVAPTQHLKRQWSAAAAAFGLELDPDWSPRGGPLPGDMHGAVVTYHQVASDPRPIAAVARSGFVVLDEVHHAAAERAWGDGLVGAFRDAARRLALSGTPFRSDDSPIPFVRYIDGEAVADFTYGYVDALDDGGVVRPVTFPRVNGRMEWSDREGQRREATFDDVLGRQDAAQRLRTALAPDGRWLPAVLARAHRRLAAVRRGHADAGGLVLAIDQDHARAIARLLRSLTGTAPVVAVSDRPDASAAIAAYAAGRTPWLVAVRMVSEGVDIPRLRVGVWATNTVTELFFRQAVGRLVRHQREIGGDQRAWMFLPDDARLRGFAGRMREELAHRLRPSAEDHDPEIEQLERAADTRTSSAQLSLFAAIDSEAVGDVIELETARSAGGPADTPPDTEVRLELRPPPPPPGARTAGPVDRRDLEPRSEPRRPRSQVKRELRAANSERVRAISRLLGLSHREVNAELNRRVGLGRIAQATESDLERRLTAAEDWLQRSR